MQKNKIALITGATKGIGKALADKFYENNFKIIGCARNPGNVNSEFDIQLADFSEKDQVLKFASYVKNNNPKIDVLINNAGEFAHGSFLTENSETIYRLLQINFLSAYELTRSLIPLLQKSPTPAIINIISIKTKTLPTDSIAYTLSKLALDGFTKIIRKTLQKQKIRVIGIYPGAVLTSSWNNSGIPEQKFILPHQLAEIIYNAYNSKSNYVIEEIIINNLDF